MSGAILRAAGELIAAGIAPDELAGVLEAKLRLQHGAWAEAVVAGEEAPDLSRLAALVAADGMDLAEAEYLLGRDADDAIADAEHRRAHPDPRDDPRQVVREISRLKAVRERRERAWSDALSAADYALDATVTYAAAAPGERLTRPTATYEEAVALVEATIADAIAGRGPAHVLIRGATDTRKTFTTLRLIGCLAAERREARRRWIQDYRRDNLGCTYADAADAAAAAGVRHLRVLFVGEYHEQLAEPVRLAREQFGMLAEHHGGYDRGYDPADPASPPVCTQPARLKQTQLAGESVPDKACGRSVGAEACPDRSGCRRWQRLTNCAHAEFVATTIDNAFAPFLPRELTGFDLVIMDEAPDRAGYGESEVRLDYLSDRHFGPHPVRDADGQPDIAANNAARAEYKLVRDILDAAPNGYAPMDALRAAGFDADRWRRLIAWTEARDTPSGMTSATPDDERGELARQSFRRQIRALCGLFRQLAAPGDGWVRLADDDERRVAVVRRVRTLHPSILDGRIIALDGSADLTSWRRFIPSIEAVTTPRPRTPHQTAVQIVRPNGKHAMRDPARKAYDQALVALYAQGQTGVLTHKAHAADFAAPGIITGHYGALAGRNDWKHCSTMFAFGLPFLSPEGAAHEGAGRTGEALTPEMPVRTLRPVMMKDGGVTLVPSMEYQHPAAREAQAAVRERQAMQGPGGRPRAASRTADNPVTLLYAGTTPLPGVEFDHVITAADQFAPDRFVRMTATGLVVASGRDRHRLHPDIYPQKHTAEYDAKREAGGMIATLQRVLFPPWWRDRPREPWIELRYWVKGRGNRVPGRAAACPAGALPYAKERLRDACGAVRFEVVADVHRPAGEVTRIPISDDLTWILGTYPRRVSGPLFRDVETAQRVEKPPDG